MVFVLKHHCQRPLKIPTQSLSFQLFSLPVHDKNSLVYYRCLEDVFVKNNPVETHRNWIKLKTISKQIKEPINQ